MEYKVVLAEHEKTALKPALREQLVSSTVFKYMLSC